MTRIPLYRRNKVVWSFAPHAGCVQAGSILGPEGCEVAETGGVPVLRIPLGVSGKRVTTLLAIEAREAARRGDFGLAWEEVPCPAS